MNFSFLFTVNAWLCKTPTARGTPPRPVASPWLRSPQPPNLRSSRAFSPDTLINVRITVRHLNSPPRLQLSGTTNISLFLGFSAIVKAKNRTPSSIQPPVETVGKNICFFSFSFLDFVFVVTTTLLAWARFGCVCVCVCCFVFFLVFVVDVRWLWRSGMRCCVVTEEPLCAPCQCPCATAAADSATEGFIPSTTATSDSTTTGSSTSSTTTASTTVSISSTTWPSPRRTHQGQFSQTQKTNFIVSAYR